MQGWNDWMGGCMEGMIWWGDAGLDGMQGREEKRDRDGGDEGLQDGIQGRAERMGRLMRTGGCREGRIVWGDAG